MEITIKTIKHSDQEYETVGNWHFDAQGNLNVFVSNMDNDDYAFLVGLHEMIEAWLCRKRGISDESITEFDKVFEQNRKEGNTDEPGDDKLAPYNLEHS